MKRAYIIPADTPAAACGRCLWFTANLDKDGFAQCVYWRERRYYKCMICPEYENDNDKITGARAR